MAGLPPFAWATTIRKAEETLAFCQKAAEFLRAVSKLKILDGQFIEVDFVATDRVDFARHTLGRPYNGGFVVMSDNTTATPMVSVFPAALAAKFGIDPRVYVPIGSPTVFTAKLTVWVF